MDRRSKRDLVNELDNWTGVLDYKFETGGRHNRMTVVTESGSRFIIMSITPSDGRAARNRTSDLCKILREIGAVRK